MLRVKLKVIHKLPTSHKDR